MQLAHFRTMGTHAPPEHARQAPVCCTQRTWKKRTVCVQAKPSLQLCWWQLCWCLAVWKDTPPFTHMGCILQQQYLLPTIPIVYTACMLTTHESPSARLQHSKQSWLGPAGFCCLLQVATAGNSYSGAHHLKECMVHWHLHDVIHCTPHATNCKQAMVHGHLWKGFCSPATVRLANKDCHAMLCP